jgi:hypothetical protein
MISRPVNSTSVNVRLAARTQDLLVQIPLREKLFVDIGWCSDSVYR